MKVGIGLPFIQPTESWPAIRKLVERADEASFSSFTVTDRVVYDSYEVMSLLTAVAPITGRLRLQTAVLVGPLRNPAVLAKQAATLDAISGGRFTLGIAVGSRADDSVVAGVDHHTRGKRFDEQIDVMKRIWSGEHFEGAQYDVGPKPVQKGGPELLLGGTADRAIDRWGGSPTAMCWGDGHGTANGLVRSWRRSARPGRNTIGLAAHATSPRCPSLSDPTPTIFWRR